MLNEQGYEVPDQTPVSLPTRLRLPQSRAAQIQGFIRAELSRAASDKGFETFEESNDLEVGENEQFGITAYERSAEFGIDDMETLSTPADKAAPAATGAPAPDAEHADPAPAGTT